MQGGDVELVPGQLHRNYRGHRKRPSCCMADGCVRQHLPILGDMQNMAANGAMAGMFTPAERHDACGRCNPFRNRCNTLNVCAGGDILLAA